MKYWIVLFLLFFVSGCVEPINNLNTAPSIAPTSTITPPKYNDTEFLAWYSGWMKTVNDNNTRLSNATNSHDDVRNVMMFGESWFDITNRNYRSLHGYKVSSTLKPTYDEMEQAVIEEQQRGQALITYKIESAEILNTSINGHYKLAKMYLNEYSGWKARTGT